MSTLEDLHKKLAETNSAIATITHQIAQKRRDLKKILVGAITSPSMKVRIHNYNNAYHQSFMPHNLGQDGFICIERRVYTWDNDASPTREVPYRTEERQCVDAILNVAAQHINILYTSDPLVNYNLCLIAFKFKK